MAAEVTLTKWLDPALKYFADQAGIPVEDYSSRVGGEGIATGIEALTDLFSKGWLNKLIQMVTGATVNLYGVFGKDVPVRLRKELISWGLHSLLRFVDPKPSELIELHQSIESFVDALKRGDVEGMKGAILRSPSEWQTMLAALGVPVEKGLAIPTPLPGPAFPPTASSEGQFERSGKSAEKAERETPSFARY